MIVNARSNRLLMRKTNTKLVLDTLRACAGTLSQVELVRQTGLSVGTIVRIVRDLKELNLLEAVGPGPSHIGRRPTQLRFNRTAMYVVAVDLEPDEAALALLDLAGGVRLQQAFGVDAAQGPAMFYREFQLHLRKMLKGAKVPYRRVAGVGLASHGIVDFHAGRLVMSKHLGWQDVPIKQELKRILKLPVFVESSARAMAIGEQRWGVGQGIDSLVLLEIDAGIGLVPVIHGQVYRGGHGLAGELGQNIPIPLSSKPTVKKTCLEDVASGKAMIANAQKAMRQKHGIALAGLSRATSLRQALRLLFKSAAQGDPLAAKVVDNASRHLGFTIANMINLLDPELIILAGCAVSEGADLFITRISKIVKQHAWPSSRCPIAIEKSSLGDSAALLGAATLVYDDLFSINSDLLSITHER